MAAWLELLAACAEPPLWLDDTAYTGRLLAGGRVPWLEVTGLIGWRVKAATLLNPPLATLDVGAIAAAFVAASPARHAALAGERGPTGLLAAMLAAVDLRQHVAEVLQGLRRSSRVPLAIVMPSPRAWPALAYSNAFGERPVIGADETDDASVHMADFLRTFGATGVDVLLLTDDSTSRPRTQEEVDWYQSVLNVGHHYRWDVGLKTPETPAGGEGGFDFLIAPKGARGVDVGEAFWDTDAGRPAVGPGGFLYARIPEDAAPERVLARLASLGRP